MFSQMHEIDFCIAGTLLIESLMTEEEKWKFCQTVWKNFMEWFVLLRITLMIFIGVIFDICPSFCVM